MLEGSRKKKTKETTWDVELRERVSERRDE
jgi:hypothetical protein